MSSATRNACGLLFGWVLGLSSPGAAALNPALDLNQYAHTAWRIREGFANGRILALAQTSDGFLWLGTESGLLRFDGLRPASWQPPRGARLDNVSTLLAANDGDLWIGSPDGLARLTHGQFVSYPQLEEGLWPYGIAEDRQATLWMSVQFFHAASPTSALCAIRDRTTECYGRDGRFGAHISAPLEDRQGNLWIATAMRWSAGKWSEAGIWRWQPGPPQHYALPDGVADPFRSLAETPTGVLVLTPEGFDELVDGRVNHHWVAAGPLGWHPQVALTDRDGAVWIGTEHGLVHLHDGRMDRFSKADGLSGDNIGALLEDHEGNIWVATTEGLDRFRNFAATLYSDPQGITGLKGSLLADRNGSIWFSTSSGLYHWAGGRFTAYGSRKTAAQTTSGDSARQPPLTELPISGFPAPSTASLFQDHLGRIWLGTDSGVGYLEGARFVSIEGMPRGYIDSITEDRHGNLWVAHRDAGLFELSADRIVNQISWATAAGRSGFAYRLAMDPVLGGLWIGSSSGRIAHFVDGQVQASYGAAEGLPKGEINEIRVRADGTVWVATDGGLSRLKDGRLVTLDQKGGLPCDRVDSTVDDDDGSLWLYMSCGLGRISATELQSWDGRRDSRERSQLKIELLDSSDGVPGFLVLPTYSPHIAKSTDGRIWVLTHEGPAEIDTHHLPFNRVAPPVHIERIIADRTPYEGHSLLQLPPLLRDLEIDYTALSLVAPEKNQFRYKLEHHDREWKNVGTRRQAFYSDLPPGNYRFRVVASNNSGVWNDKGASLDFSIAPAYWQTTWFRALCIAAILAFLWMLYWLRLRQVARNFERTLDARVAERTRIARDLHDTLLQSFNALLLHFSMAARLFRSEPDKALKALDETIVEARRAIKEGREAVQGLRSSTEEPNDLAAAIGQLASELSGRTPPPEPGDDSAPHPIELRVQVEGGSRQLHPIVRDELYRIAAEALRNAYQHSHATRIEVELRYDLRQFRLEVRDDGRGIEQELLASGGKEGHFGLKGMRERAELAGGKLTVWSALGSGTEVEVTIPASKAYAVARSRTDATGESTKR